METMNPQTADGQRGPSRHSTEGQRALTLFDIEIGLLQLIQYRETLAEDSDITPEEQKRLIAVADQEIQDYVAREVAKADGIAAYLKEFERREEIAKEQAKAISERGKIWARRREALEDTVIRVMQMAGKTTIEGQNATLTLRKCPPSVEIKQPELIPGEFYNIAVKLPCSAWIKVCEALLSVSKHLSPEHRGALDALWVRASDATVQPRGGDVLKARIAVELKAGCGVPGAELVTDKVRLEVK